MQGPLSAASTLRDCFESHYEALFLEARALCGDDPTAERVCVSAFRYLVSRIVQNPETEGIDQDSLARTARIWMQAHVRALHANRAEGTYRPPRGAGTAGDTHSRNASR